MMALERLPEHVASFVGDVVRELVADRNRRLLFLSVQGSRLFGLDNENSDWDLKGVYAPAPGELLRGNKDGASRPVARSSGGREKNTAFDVDVQLWPVHFWLMERMARGEGTSLDLFWSHAAPGMVVYCDPAMWTLFDNPDKVVRVVEGCQNSFAGFAEKQAAVYSAKSRHFEMVSKCVAYLGQLKADIGGNAFAAGTVETIVDEIGELVGNDPEFFELLDPCDKGTLDSGQDGRCNGQTVLRFCKKSIHLTAKLPYFEEFLRARLGKYGRRAREASDGGIDLKAYCHAFRSWSQLVEILDTGRLTYPIPGRDTAMAIKGGHLTPSEVMEVVSDARDRALARPKTAKGDFDRDFCERFIMSLYGG